MTETVPVTAESTGTILKAAPESAISYGKLNPSDQEHFSRLLCFSICVSLLGAGATALSAEGAARNVDRPVVRSGSGYGMATILLRACQTAMLVFWIALMACAEKGYAIYAVVASLIVYVGVLVEAAYGRLNNIVQRSANTGCCKRSTSRGTAWQRI